MSGQYVSLTTSASTKKNEMGRVEEKEKKNTGEKIQIFDSKGFWFFTRRTNDWQLCMCCCCSCVLDRIVGPVRASVLITRSYDIPLVTGGFTSRVGSTCSLLCRGSGRRPVVRSFRLLALEELGLILFVFVVQCEFRVWSRA